MATVRAGLSKSRGLQTSYHGGEPMVALGWEVLRDNLCSGGDSARNKRSAMSGVSVSFVGKH